jgi:hypothetical protein
MSVALAGLTLRNAEESVLDVVFSIGAGSGFGFAAVVGDICDDTDWSGELVGGVPE